MLAQEVKTEYETLQEDIKKIIDREYTEFMVNPFSCLSVDKKSIEIHGKFAIPGAAEYFLKQKDNSRSRKIGGGLGGGPTGLAQPSTSNNRQTDSRANDSSKKK